MKDKISPSPASHGVCGAMENCSEDFESLSSAVSDAWERMKEVWDAAAADFEEASAASARSYGNTGRTSLQADGTASVGTVDFASSSLGKSSSAQINTMLSGIADRGGNYNISLVVDGRTLADVVFDPLTAAAKQKGVKSFA